MKRGTLIALGLTAATALLVASRRNPKKTDVLGEQVKDTRTTTTNAPADSTTPEDTAPPPPAPPPFRDQVSRRPYDRITPSREAAKREFDEMIGSGPLSLAYAHPERVDLDQLAALALTLVKLNMPVEAEQTRDTARRLVASRGGPKKVAEAAVAYEKDVLREYDETALKLANAPPPWYMHVDAYSLEALAAKLRPLGYSGAADYLMERAYAAKVLRHYNDIRTVAKTMYPQEYKGETLVAPGVYVGDEELPWLPKLDLPEMYDLAGELERIQHQDEAAELRRHIAAYERGLRGGGYPRYNPSGILITKPSYYGTPDT